MDLRRGASVRVRQYTRPAVGLLFHQLVAFAGSEAGARERFQHLVTQLVVLRNPSIVPREIRPDPGDGGIDTFTGEIDGALAVWQSKLFSEVGSVQQKQVRESFHAMVRTAAEHAATLEMWTLCVPCSLSLTETTWWDRWRKRMQRDHGVTIDLWDETRLETLLNSPDAAAVRATYLGPGAQTALDELAILPVPDPAAMDDYALCQTAAGRRLYRGRLGEGTILYRGSHEPGDIGQGCSSGGRFPSVL